MADLKPLVLNPPLNRTIIRDIAGLELLKEFFKRCGYVIGWDIETPPLKDFFWRRVRTIQFGNQSEQFVIDLLALCGGDSDLLWKAQGYYGINLTSAPGLQAVVETIRPALCSKDYLKVGVNLGFEYENFYWQLGLRTWHFYDCMLAEKCIWAGAHSMKDYGFYSMEAMMARYFQVQIDKTLQQSFTVDCVLTDEQADYACLDTRLPLALRSAQSYILQGETPESLIKKNLNGAAKMLATIDPLVLCDDLVEIAKIENDAIGAFQDMHVHGERLDVPKWAERVERKKAELKKIIAEDLDPVFVPIVGHKSQVITDDEIAAADEKWKAYRIVTPEETTLAKYWRDHKKTGAEPLATFEAAHTVVVYSSKGVPKRILKLEAERKEKKEELKKQGSELGKRRTVIRNLAAKCAGEALINFNSPKQLLNIFHGIKGLKTLTGTDDETLEKFSHVPVIAAFRKYRTLSKEIGTYGDSWITEWKTGPSGEEGWLHPGDQKLHCTFNQYDASTGRSSSDKPNGQNLPKDKDLRSCFIVDPPDEGIRISACCEAETTTMAIAYNPCAIPDGVDGNTARVCNACGQPCEHHAEEYVMVTADMSGAELRILAERSKEQVWIDAFNRDEDVHSVCTDMMYTEKWPKLALPNCAFYMLHTAETVAKNTNCKIGDAQRQKCKCPEHNALRDGTKPVNFGIPYGISARALSPQIGKPEKVCAEIMALHKQAFPTMHKYVDEAGNKARMNKKSFDMYGRRRLFPEPTWEAAKEKAKEDREEQLRFDEDQAEQNVSNFIALKGRKPDAEEKWFLLHRLPTAKEIANAYKAMHGSIERQGKNMEIQGTNATIAKLAMGCGYCPEGKPYLWHTLSVYKAKLIKFVHDELVVQCPKRFGQIVADLIGDAFRRAAAEKMKQVAMTFDYAVASHWKK